MNESDENEMKIQTQILALDLMKVLASSETKNPTVYIFALSAITASCLPSIKDVKARKLLVDGFIKMLKSEFD